MNPHGCIIAAYDARDKGKNGAFDACEHAPIAHDHIISVMPRGA
jgi:hypothetical protein